MVTENDRVLAHFDEFTEPQTPIQLPSGANAAWFDYGTAWATGYNSGELYRVYAATGAVTDRIPIRPLPRAITSCAGSIWVLSQGDNFGQRIDAHTRRVVASIDTAHDHVGTTSPVAVATSGSASQRTGRTDRPDQS